MDRRLPCTAIIVSYNHKDSLRKSVLSALDNRCNVVVVDNASLDGSPDSVADLPCRIIRNKKNMGFSYACNQGVRLADTPYILFLNPDCRLEDGTVEKMMKVDADAVIPVIYNEDGLESMGLAPSKAGIGLHILSPRDKLFGGSGACFLIRKEVFVKLGGFDEDFFAYYEDLDFFWRFNTSGFTAKLCPNAKVSHKKKRKNIYFLHRNKFLFILKNWNLYLIISNLFTIILYDLLSILWAFIKGEGFEALRARMDAFIIGFRMLKKRKASMLPEEYFVKRKPWEIK